MAMTREHLKLSYLEQAAKGDVSLQYVLAASDLFADKLELQQENAQLRERIVAQEPQPEGKPGKPVPAQVQDK